MNHEDFLQRNVERLLRPAAVRPTRSFRERMERALAGSSGPSRFEWLPPAIVAATALISVSLMIFTAGEPRHQGPGSQSGEKVDLYGDPLPPGAIARLGTVRFRGPWSEGSVAFTPDGREVVTAGLEITFWDAETGKRIRSLKGPAGEKAGRLGSTALSPDGRFLASASEATILIWDLASGALRATLKEHSGPVTCVRFSPDSKSLVSTGEDRSVILWESGSWRPLRRFEGHTDKVYVARFNRKGDLLATAGNDEAIRLWNPRTGAAAGILEGHRNCVTALAFSPDGKSLASGSGIDLVGWQDKEISIRVWDLETQREKRTFPGGRRSVKCVDFSPDGRYLLWSGTEHTLHVADAESGNSLERFPATIDEIEEFAFSPDGRRIATAGSDLRIWDFDSGRERPSFPSHNQSVKSLEIAPDGRTVAVSGWGPTITVWSVADGKLVHRLEGHNCPVPTVAYSPDGGMLISASDDDTVRVWDPRRGLELRSFPVRMGRRASRHVFSSDGRYIASGSTYVRLLDPETGRTLWEKSVQQGIICYPVNSLAFTSDGREILSHHQNGQINVWETESGAEVRSFPTHPGGGSENQMELLPGGAMVATTDTGESVGRVWAVASGSSLLELKGHGRHLMDISAHPGGLFLATASKDNTVRVWELFSGGEILKIDFGAEWPWRAAFFPDGRRLAIGMGNGNVTIWDLAHPALAAPLREDRFDRLWEILGDPSAARAHQATRALAARPDLAEALAGRLCAEPAEDGEVKGLVEMLASDDILARERATRSLREKGPGIEPLLRKALQSEESPEAESRLRGLLESLDAPIFESAEMARPLRALLALEFMEGRPGTEALKTVAEKAPWARLRREAKAALGRIALRP